MGHQPETLDQRLAAIAARQHSAFNHRQAREVGFTDRQIGARLASRRWLPAVDGVYTMAGARETWQTRAMVALLATENADSVLSHVSAGAAYAVRPPSPLPHVSVAPGHSARCRAAKIHRTVVPPQDRRVIDSLRVTTPSRYLVDMASLLTRTALEDVVDDVLCRRLASRESTLASLDRAGKGRRGLALLREVLAVWGEDIEPGSPAEVRLLRLLDELNVPGVVTQFEVRDANGLFVANLDIAIPPWCKGLEYDSVRWHNPRRWQRDEARYGRLRALGWEVPAVTKLDLIPGERRLADLAARWLATAAAA